MENELVVQVSMKQEMELAMKLLEKDIHEKQVSTDSHHLFLADLHTWTLSLSFEFKSCDLAV